MEETGSVEREIDAKVRARHNVSLPVGSEEKLEEGFEKYEGRLIGHSNHGTGLWALVRVHQSSRILLFLLSYFLLW